MDWSAFQAAFQDLEWKYEVRTSAAGLVFIHLSIPSLSLSTHWSMDVIPSPLPVAYIPGEQGDETTPEEEKGYYSVEFLIPLPLSIKPNAQGNIIQLIAFANSNVPLPGFQWNALDETLSYRYVWFFHIAFLESTILLLILQAIQAALETYGPLLEKVSEGKTTLADAMKAWGKEMTSLEENPFE